jgi:hypothetical protein
VRHTWVFTGSVLGFLRFSSSRWVAAFLALATATEPVLLSGGHEDHTDASCTRRQAALISVNMELSPSAISLFE